MRRTNTTNGRSTQNIEYVGGFPYGVGRLTYANDGSVIPNKTAYYPGSNALLDPNESPWADGRVCCTSIVANLNLYYEITPKAQIGVQIQNINHDYRATALEQNPYFPAAVSADGVTPGFNGFYSYGNSTYIPASLSGTQQFLFTFTTKI